MEFTKEDIAFLAEKAKTVEFFPLKGIRFIFVSSDGSVGGDKLVEILKKNGGALSVVADYTSLAVAYQRRYNIQDGERVVYIGRRLLTEARHIRQGKFVLAHEIAHHVLGHHNSANLTHLQNPISFLEVEADCFAARLLGDVVGMKVYLTRYAKDLGRAMHEEADSFVRLIGQRLSADLRELENDEGLIREELINV